MPNSQYAIFTDPEFTEDLISKGVEFVERWYEGLDEIDQYSLDPDTTDNFFVQRLKATNDEILLDRQSCEASFLDHKQWLIPNPSKVHII